MTRVLRPLLTALLALAVAVPLAGCGADELKPDLVAEAAARTSASEGAKARVDMEMPVPGGATVPLTMTGVVNLKGDQGHFEFDMSELAEGAEGVSGDDLRGEQIMDGGTMYMRMGALEEELGKPWMKIDLEKALGAEGGMQGLEGMSSMSPGDQLDMLRATGEIEEVAEGHYRGHIDLQRYLDDLDEGQRRATRRILEEAYPTDDSRRIPVEAWIDERGYLTRQKLELRMPIGDGGEARPTTMDMRFSDFGTRVRIEPPADDEVVDMTDETRREIERQGG
jgi:hypothetical protein